MKKDLKSQADEILDLAKAVASIKTCFSWQLLNAIKHSCILDKLK